jgi:hypothetical protein
MSRRLALSALQRFALSLAALLSISGRALSAADEGPPQASAAPPPAPAPVAPAAGAATPAADAEGALLALARDLELVVTELGPDMPWTLHLHNRGSTPIGLMADPGLLWFEVAVPGAPAPHVCRLPEPLWPKRMRRRAEVLLPAGERFSRRFDPRFFCFADRVQTVLVPGARVIPHFGWPREVATTVVKRKRVEQPLPLRAPFVAWVLPPGVETTMMAPVEAPNPDDDENDAEPSSEPPWQPPTEGLKNVVGTATVLSPAYGKWSERPPAPSGGLQLAMLAGSDAEDERSAVVTVGLANAGDTPQLVVARRDLISFNVVGPDGSFECPASEIGAPDVESFTTLAPRASQELVVRLIEMCPRGDFSRPGLYEVRATWHGKFSGQALGLDAFVGTVSSPRAALVRVRSGERASFLRSAPMVAKGAPADAKAAPAPRRRGGEAEPAPNEGAPTDAPPAEDTPGDREAPATPDDATHTPEPAPVPEGTQVE